MTGDSHVHDQVELYALGMLEAEEIEAVETHLSVCASCRQAVAEAEEITSLLAHAVPVLAPPEHVRDKLFAQVRAEAAVVPVAPEPVAPVIVFDHRWRRWLQWWRPLAAVGAGVVVLLLGLTLTTQQALDAEREQTRELAPRATEEAQLVSLLISPQSTTVALKPAKEKQAAKGRLLLDHQKGKVLLVVNQLPVLSEGQIYQVWLCNEYAWRPAGRFRVGREGSATMEMPMPYDGFGYRWVWVTVEPVHGSEEPSGEMVLTATF